MVQLETVEDFEKIKKALEDNTSQQKDYCICPYDYCNFCKGVREFETPYGYSVESTVWAKCLGNCGSLFHNGGPQVRTPYFHFGNYELPPEQFWDLLQMVNSRQMQSKFFAAELEKRISAEKKKMIELKSSFERLAKLRFYSCDVGGVLLKEI